MKALNEKLAIPDHHSSQLPACSWKQRIKDMVLLQSLVKTCKHLAVSPRGLAQPAEPLHLINALGFKLINNYLGFQQIKNDLGFQQIKKLQQIHWIFCSWKFVSLLPDQLSPGSCMTFVILPWSSSPFCPESIIYCLFSCGACLLPVSMPSRSSIVFIQLVEPAL